MGGAFNFRQGAIRGMPNGGGGNVGGPVNLPSGRGRVSFIPGMTLFPAGGSRGARKRGRASNFPCGIPLPMLGGGLRGGAPHFPPHGVFPGMVQFNGRSMGVGVGGIPHFGVAHPAVLSHPVAARGRGARVPVFANMPPHMTDGRRGDVGRAPAFGQGAASSVIPPPFPADLGVAAHHGHVAPPNVHPFSMVEGGGREVEVEVAPNQMHCSAGPSMPSLPVSKEGSREVGGAAAHGRSSTPRFPKADKEGRSSGKEEEVKLSSQSIKRIKDRLMLILHSFNCTFGGEGAPPCPVNNCDVMKNVLVHMDGCREGRSCPCESLKISSPINIKCGFNVTQVLLTAVL